VTSAEDVPIKRQCELFEFPRSSFYFRPVRTSMREVDEMFEEALFSIHANHPFYGYRKVARELRSYGIFTGEWRVRSERKRLGIRAICPGPNTSAANTQHEKYPYLLRGLIIGYVNQVWATDITYLRTDSGFMYLVAIVDLYSRRVLSYRLSNSLSASFCVATLKDAINTYGVPEIFNTDQGSQFTGDKWIDVLKSNRIRISMDGKGRALDNIYVERLWRSLKYEDIYLNDYENVLELKRGVAKYFTFYNTRRFHQSLDYQTPDEVYFAEQQEAA